ncbi:MAG: tetratricopeptide repeat protein [Nitrospinae bacterium]|nr:tetratricopeptide repeat protein [Nitrospinota bacterium]
MVLLLAVSAVNARAQVSPADQNYAQAVAAFKKEGFAGVDRAIASFERILRGAPDHTPSQLGLADALILKYEFSRKKDPAWMARAEALLTGLANDKQRAPEALFKRAVTRFNQNRPGAAAADLREAIALRPQYLDARLLYLQYLVSGGDKAQARPFAQESLAAFSGAAAPAKYFGDALLQGGDWEGAVEMYRAVVAQEPVAPFSWLGLGKALAALGKHPEAAEAYRRALEQKPGLDEARFGLGAALAESGDIGGAIANFEEHVKRQPDDAAALNNLAVLYERGGQNTKAKITWLKLKQMSDNKDRKERADARLRSLLSEPAQPNGGDVK